MLALVLAMEAYTKQTFAAVKCSAPHRLGDAAVHCLTHSHDMTPPKPEHAANVELRLVRHADRYAISHRSPRQPGTQMHRPSDGSQ